MRKEPLTSLPLYTPPRLFQTVVSLKLKRTLSLPPCAHVSSPKGGGIFASSLSNLSSPQLCRWHFTSFWLPTSHNNHIHQWLINLWHNHPPNNPLSHSWSIPLIHPCNHEQLKLRRSAWQRQYRWLRLWHRSLYRHTTTHYHHHPCLILLQSSPYITQFSATPWAGHPSTCHGYRSWTWRRHPPELPQAPLL